MGIMRLLNLPVISSSAAACIFLLITIPYFPVRTSETNEKNQQQLVVSIKEPLSSSKNKEELTTLRFCCNREDDLDLQKESYNDADDQNGDWDYKKLCAQDEDEDSDSNLNFFNPIVAQLPKELMYTNVSNRFLISGIDDKDEDAKLPCIKGRFTKIISYNGFYPNGYLRIGTDFYAPDEYCIERMVSPTSISVKVCHPDCGGTRACIPKCCNLDKVYNLGILKDFKGCHPSWLIDKDKLGQSHNFYFNPPLYKDFQNKVDNPNNHQPLPHFFYWKIREFKFTNCERNETSFFPFSHWIANNLTEILGKEFHSIPFRIREDGSILYRDGVGKRCGEIKDPKRVLCIDGFQDYGSQLGFRNTEDEYGIHMCTTWNVKDVKGHGNELVYGILLIISSVFPLMTFTVYAVLWTKQNVHGWTIATTTGSLFVMYMTQGVSLIIAGSYEREDLERTRGCLFTALMSHFSYLAAFAWMTVMCCNLWLTFRRVTPVVNRRYQKGLETYLRYSLFGWGYPTLFVGTGGVLHYYYTNIADDDCSSPHSLITSPSYATVNCYIAPNAQAIYHFYPAAFLLSMNVGFFTLTCYKLLIYHKKSERFAKEGDCWKGFVRFFKLFLVMGVSWVFETISWAIDGFTLKWYWIFFDVINVTRVVFIFVIYVCKQDVLSMLEEVHPSIKKIFGLRRIPSALSNCDQTMMSTCAAVTPTTQRGPPEFPMAQIQTQTQTQTAG